MKRRILELVGEKPEARNIGGPAPARGREGEQRHLDGIAGLGAIDIDGSRHRIDLGEIELAEIGERRLRRDLAAR